MSAVAITILSIAATSVAGLVVWGIQRVLHAVLSTHDAVVTLSVTNEADHARVREHITEIKVDVKDLKTESGNLRTALATVRAQQEMTLHDVRRLTGVQGGDEVTVRW